MKKKIMSAEALARLAGLSTAAAAGTGVEADAGTVVVPDVEVTTEASEETTPEITAEEIAGIQAQVETVTAANEDLTAKLAEAGERIAALEAEKLAVDARLAAAAEETKEFKAIVLNQITTMRTALSVAAVDMTHWTAEAILREHAATLVSFEKALPMGSVVQESTENKEVKVVVSSHDAAAVKSLGFK